MKYKYFKDSEIKDLDPFLVKLLDQARGWAGIPFYITSGYRTPEKNAEVGGIENSAHCHGLAADIRALDDIERLAIVNGALHAGFTRIGIGKFHVHLDIDNTKTQEVLFIESNAIPE